MKALVLVCCLIAVPIKANAQKFGYVDTEYILKHIPEYAKAQKQLDGLSEQWQKEVDSKFQDIDRLYKEFQKDEVLLSSEMRKRREQEIVDKEKAAKDLQKQRFGPEGEVFKRRQILVKAVQDRVYRAIQEVADDGLYAVIFDKSGAPLLLYASPRYDKSNDVILKLGLKPGTFAK